MSEIAGATVTVDSSTHGAQMLIQLKEGTIFTPVQASNLKVLAEEAISGALQTSSNVICETQYVELPHIAEHTEDDIQETRLTSIGVQANDYEIERRSGIVPARKRLVPFKFRDFHNPDSFDEEQDDEDYIPDDISAVVKKPRKPTRPGARPVGRPRKVRNDGQVKEQKMDSEASTTTDVANETESTQTVIGFPRRGRPPKDDPSRLSKMFKCLQCDKKFSLKGNLKTHMRTHSDERPYKCDIENCTKTFRSNECLRRHTLAHQGIKMFPCEICEKRFASNVGLHEHMARHTDTKSHLCHVCNRAFRQVSCLKRHLLTHSDIKPHECTTCGKRFSQLVYLRSHNRSHTGERPFKCGTCGKAFAHQSDVARHMNIHLGTKPFGCDICGARFSDPSTQRRHVREHSGIKPYCCQLCGEFFKRSGQLKAHLNKKHMNYREDVLITKQGPFKSLQFQFKGNKNTGVSEQLQAQQAMNGTHYVQVATEDGSQEVLALAPGSDTVELVDENGELQHIQVQQVSHADSDNSTTLREIQQQLVQAGITQSQLDGNQIILAQASSHNKEVLLEETQQIIQHIQSQLEPGVVGGVEAGQQVKVAYHILHDDDNQQIVEIQYHPVIDGNTAGIQDGEEIVIASADSGNVEIQPVEQSQSNVDYASVDQVIEATDNEQSEIVQTYYMSSEQHQPSQLNVDDNVENGPSSHVHPAVPEHRASNETNDNVPLPSNASCTYAIENKVVSDSDHQETYNEVCSPECSEVEESEIVENTENAVDQQQGVSEDEVVLSFEVLEQQQRDAGVDYVANPDFNCQEFYNWLSSFTELCKHVSMPLAADRFQQMSNVHKSLSDVLATPKGILTNKENFKILMNISRDLNSITNEHLSFVLQQLDSELPS